jgi:sugar/nucleoside kinase (ribokinase family)
VLCVIGDLVEDIVVWLPESLNYGADTPSRIVRTRGGSASNVAVFAATVARKETNQAPSSRLIAQVGDDRLGDQLIGALRDADVDPCVVRGGRTGSIVVIVSPDGERTMLTDRATSTQLQQVPEKWFESVSLLHVPAYSLFSEPLATAARSCIATAHDQNIPVSIDASSASLIKEFGVNKFRELIRQLRPKIFFCNTDEAEVLNLTTQPLDLDIVVIKAGARPTTLIENNVVKTIEVEPVGEIIDTTGAGDAFAAGFLTKFGENNLDTHICVLAGHQLAARVLRSPGATMDAQ